MHYEFERTIASLAPAKQYLMLSYAPTYTYLVKCPHSGCFSLPDVRRNLVEHSRLNGNLISLRLQC